MTYRELLRRTYQPFRPIPLLLLPNTKVKFKQAEGPGEKIYDFSPATVARVAKAGFLEWAGTTDMEAARKKFKACVAAIPN